jgi:hypothetical protein
LTRPPSPDRVTRAAVIGAFKALPPGTAISTLGLAWLIDCIEEHRIRAAVSWLALGGLVEMAGEHPRRDRRGRSYACRLYRWSGQEEIRRVRHRPEDRRRERDEAAQVDVGALALAWLARPPPSRAAGTG